MKLIFMGTPEFAVPSLGRLISDGHRIAAVFTQPDKPAGRGKNLHAPPVKKFAIERGIPVYQPAKIKANEEARSVFDGVAPDACIVAAYGKILPQWMLALPRLGSINVHASLLPKYRGAAPINWAIANGEHETGVTIMQMDAGMDTGGMFATRTIEIGSEETAPELSARLSELGAALLSETLPLIERGEIKPTPQEDKEATYAPMLKRENGLIDWQMTAREISNRVRAFQPWPGTYTFFRGGRLTIWRAREADVEGSHVEGGHVEGSHIEDTHSDYVKAEPATIIGLDKTGIVVACACSTLLSIEELQVEGKRRLAAREFVNGMRLGIGDRITESRDR
jgi:methionyl-tRNA formyltransferase